MKRWLKFAAGGVVFLAILGGSAAMFGPKLLEEEVETRLRERLEARGIDAKWGDFVAHGGSSFELVDVDIAVPDKGVGFSSDRVVVGVSLGAIWRGDVRLTEVEIEPTTLHIDVEAAVVEDLREEADVGQRGRVAVAEAGGLDGGRELRLQRAEGLRDPMAEPRRHRGVVCELAVYHYHHRGPTLIRSSQKSSARDLSVSFSPFLIQKAERFSKLTWGDRRTKSPDLIAKSAGSPGCTDQVRPESCQRD